MKKIISLLIVILMVFASFAACGGTEVTETDGETDAVTTDAVTTVPADDTDIDADPAEITPLLWKVTDKSGHELYLFGTIHAGDERTKIAIDKVSGVLESCDALAVEFDVVAYEKNIAAAADDVKRFVLTDGTTVRDSIPDDLYEKAKEILTEAGMYSPFLDYYNLAMWSQLIESALLEARSDLDVKYGVDPQLINAAYDKDIPVLDVESYDMQSDLLLGFPDELNLLLIEKSLEDADGYGAQLNSLYEAWLAGDEQAIADDGTVDDAEEQYTEHELELLDEYNKALVYDRNIGMADKAEEYLAKGQKTFFAVGCAHMVGEGGIVDLLTERGYTVERVPVE